MVKKVFVTGANGFIGSHLVEHLTKKGLFVKALCHYNSLSSYGWLHNTELDLNKDIEVILGDVRDRSFINSHLNQFIA